VASAYGWVTIAILSMVKQAHPLYSNMEEALQQSLLVLQLQPSTKIDVGYWRGFLGVSLLLINLLGYLDT
jgi:hypothetical protein